MRSIFVLGMGLVLAVSACTDDRPLTGPEATGAPAFEAAVVAAAPNTWTPRALRPSPELFGTFAAVAPNAAGHSIVYVFGGTDGEGGTGFGALAYDATTDSWGAAPGCRSSAFEAHGIAKIGSRFYFSGGYTYVETKTTLRSAYACDYTRGVLTQKASLPIFGAQGVTGAIDGKLYVLPGFCSGELWPNPAYCEQETSRRFYRYDPATNAWQARAQAPHSHRGGAAAVLDGKLYVAGGFRGEGGFTPVSDLDVYDPQTNAWKTLAPIPTPGRALGAPLQGRFFVLTDGHAYVYTPSTNTWKSRAVPQHGPDVLVLVSIDGRPRLLAVGSESTELYTP